MELSPTQSAKHLRRNIVALVIIGAVVIAAAVLSWRQRALKHAVVTLGQTRVQVDVADSIFTRERGLSGRPSLAADQGMLFIFDAPARYSFWMKEMHFPLDMIWIRDGHIVDITTDVPPPQPGQTVLPTYFPVEPADRVLEVNAGFAQAHGLRTGIEVGYELGAK